MSRKESAVKENPEAKSSIQTQQKGNAVEEQTGDFWGNLIYFLILTIAITFILANNSLSALTSTTGVTILGILVLLDFFPAAHLVRQLLNDR